MKTRPSIPITARFGSCKIMPATKRPRMDVQVKVGGLKANGGELTFVLRAAAQFVRARDAMRLARCSKASKAAILGPSLIPPL